MCPLGFPFRGPGSPGVPFLGFGFPDIQVSFFHGITKSLCVHVLEHAHCRLTKSIQYVKEAEALRGQRGRHLQGQEEVILLELFDVRIKHHPCRILAHHCANLGSPFRGPGSLEEPFLGFGFPDIQVSFFHAITISACT